jgi:glycosyltransferase involved in cell wall biosynthesis
MRIVVNLLNFRPGRIGGTETYLRELVAHLPGVVQDERIILLTSRDQIDEFGDSPLEIATVPWTTAQVCGWRLLEAAAEGLQARSIAADVARLKPDVVLFPQQSMFPKSTPWPSVLVVHDMYHRACPQYLSAVQRWFRRRSYPAAIAGADHVIAVSQTTQRSLLRHHPEVSPCTTVIPHGIREFAPGSVEPYDGAPGPYLLYPAATLPHKNHELLLCSVAALRATGRFPFCLLLTGAQTRHWRRLERLVERLRLQEVVSHLGQVPYDTILRLIRGAECIVFPSQFEGFGIPVVEAAALNRKVITSQLEVFEEIGVPPACRIDFADPEAFAEALADTSPTRLVRQPWTWSACARATLDVLRATAEVTRTLPFRQPSAAGSKVQPAGRRVA